METIRPVDDGVSEELRDSLADMLDRQQDSKASSLKRISRPALYVKKN